MGINQVKIDLSCDVPVSRLEKVLEVGNDQTKENIGVEKIKIRFDEHHHIEVNQKNNSEIRIILTSGGVSKEMDLQDLHQLLAMNY